jgi:surface protein
MEGMLGDCFTLTNLDLSKFDTSKVTDMSEMFQYCRLLTSLDLSNFNTSNVTNMSEMFQYCRLLTSLNISNFNTSKVTDMSEMFSGCHQLTSLDLSNFNTSNVTNMEGMFGGCSTLTSLDLSNFNTSNVTNMSEMFQYCRLLTSLNISKFNTSKVTDMSEMLSGCHQLTSLDLSNFNTSNVTNMEGMFGGCSTLTSLDLSNFNTSKLGNRNSSIFSSCDALQTLVLGPKTKLTASWDIIHDTLTFVRNYVSYTPDQFYALSTAGTQAGTWSVNITPTKLTLSVNREAEDSALAIYSGTYDHRNGDKGINFYISEKDFSSGVPTGAPTLVSSSSPQVIPAYGSKTYICAVLDTGITKESIVYTLSAFNYIMDVTPEGNGVGIGQVAIANKFSVGWPTDVNGGNLSVTNGTVNVSSPVTIANGGTGCMTADDLRSLIINSIYPVRSCIWMLDGISPSSSGYPGTWTQINNYYLYGGSGKVLDVVGGNTADGSNVDIYTPNGSKAQQWRLVTVNGTGVGGSIVLWQRIA